MPVLLEIQGGGHLSEVLTPVLREVRGEVTCHTFAA